MTNFSGIGEQPGTGVEAVGLNTNGGGKEWLMAALAPLTAPRELNNVGEEREEFPKVQ